MAQQLTPLQELDPGFIFSERQLQLDHAEFVPGIIDIGSQTSESFSRLGAAVVGGTFSFLSFGGLVAMESAMSTTTNAYAKDVEVCGLWNPDGSCADTFIVVIPDETTPPITQPADPPSNEGGNTNGGSNTGGNSRPTPTAPPTTIDPDKDKDTFLMDQGFFPDVDDNSFGLGEQGAIEARARGIDIDSGSDEANRNLLIAYTVNPEDWEQTTSNILAVYGVMVMTPTTTTTTTTTTELTPATSEAEIAPAITEVQNTTESTETGINTAEAVTGDNTASTIEAAVNNSEDSGDKYKTILIAGILGSTVLLICFGTVVARRREHSQEDDTPGFSGTGTSPVPGN